VTIFNLHTPTCTQRIPDVQCVLLGDNLQPSHTNVHSTYTTRTVRATWWQSSTFTHQRALNVYHTYSACYLV